MLYDHWTEKTVSLQQLKTEYMEFKRNDTDNFPDSFTEYLYIILIDTINGRNDCTIANMTAKEAASFIERLEGRIPA